MLDYVEYGGGKDALERVRDEWKTLQARSISLTPFGTWEWNKAWHTHLGRESELRVLRFYHRLTRETVGIAPLCVTRLHRLPLRQLTWMGAGVSDYHEPITLPGYEDAVADALLRVLDRGGSDWEIADLAQIREGSALSERTPRPFPHRPAAAQTVLTTEPCPYIVLPPTWDAYAATLGKKMRSNLGYYDRLLFRTFPDAKIILADESTLEEGVNALFRLHQARWNARLLPGALGGQTVRLFHRNVAQELLSAGLLRLHLLYADGDYRAALYCFATGGKTFYYLGGFSPDYAKYSLGTVLTSHAIRAAIEEGHTEFDFLRGAQEYKLRWTPYSRMNCRLLLRNSTGGVGKRTLGNAGVVVHKLERELTTRAKAFAETQGRKRQGEV